MLLKVDMIDVLAGFRMLGVGIAIGLLALGVAHAEEKAPKKGQPRFAGLPACTSSRSPDACELPLTAARAEAILQGEPGQALAYRLHGETIDIAFKTAEREFAFGDAPYLCCDLQTFLKPVAPGMWAVSIKAPKLSAAVLEITLANLIGGPAPRRAFHGPDATHPLVGARSGLLVARKRTIISRYLNESRDIHEYRGRLCARSLARCKVLYLADGDGFAVFLNNSPSPSARRALDRMVIVGIDNAGNDNQFSEKRLGALVAAAGDKAAYEAFERFVTEEVIPFVEPTPVPRTARSVGGWSNGGAWALSMALDHGDLFSSALAFSNGIWKPSNHAVAAKDLKVKFGGGTLESSTSKFKAEVRKVVGTGASVSEHYVVGGHSTSTWNALFWWAINPLPKANTAMKGD